MPHGRRHAIIMMMGTLLAELLAACHAAFVIYISLPRLRLPRSLFIVCGSSSAVEYSRHGIRSSLVGSRRRRTMRFRARPMGYRRRGDMAAVVILRNTRPVALDQSRLLVSFHMPIVGAVIFFFRLLRRRAFAGGQRDFQYRRLAR